MADFVDFEAVDDYDSYDSNAETKLDANISDVEFINDKNDFNESVETYYAFTNVNRRLEDAMQDSFIEFDYSQEANNYCPDDYDPSNDVIDEFKDSSKKFNDFRSTILITNVLENRDSFYFALLFAVRYQLKNKKDEFSVDEMQKDIEIDQLYDVLLSVKKKLRLDLDIQNFEI